MSAEPYPITMEEVTDPEELARAQDERFQRNWDWFQAHAPSIFAAHRDKFICIAGQELFVADTPTEAWARAKAAHPDDDGRFIHYIYPDKRARIYAYQRWVVPVR